MPQRPLTETSPASLNSTAATAFPLNARKRLLNSPKTPKTPNKLSMDNKQQQLQQQQLHLQQQIINRSSKETGLDNQNKKVLLRRSTGLLNLSLEASPTTQRIINTSSKNDEILKSFNRLSFENSRTGTDNEIITKKQKSKSKHIFNKSNLKKTKLEKYMDKLSTVTHNSIKKISPSKKENTTPIKKFKDEFPFFSNIKSSDPYIKYHDNDNENNNTHNNDSDDTNDANETTIESDSEPINDDSSPSKLAFNKSINSHRPFTTGSLLNNNRNNRNNSNSNNNNNNNNNNTNTNNSNTNKNNNNTHYNNNNNKPSTTSFAIPSKSFKSIKPLQTAFITNGLQSKTGRRIQNKAVPDTPCKKPPVMSNISLDLDKIRSNNIKSAPATVDIIKSSTPNSSFNSIVDNTLYTRNSNLTTENTQITKSQISPAVNTSDLQQCLLKFSNEFDDFSNFSNFSNFSIFKDTNKDDEFINENDKIPTTPNEKILKLNRLSSNGDGGTNSTPESFNSSLSFNEKFDSPTKYIKSNVVNNSSYWQRANSRNTSVQSLQPTSLPVFAPPIIPKSIQRDPNPVIKTDNNSEGSKSINSPHTPIEFEFIRNQQMPLRYSTGLQTSTPTLGSSKSTLVLNSVNSNSTFNNPTDSLCTENAETIINTHIIKNPEVDQHLISKFGNCVLLGKGEFSIVYEVQFENVKYAVKRTKQKIPGPKTRLRKLEEVEILKSLRRINEFNDNDNDDDDDDIDIIEDYYDVNDGRDYVLTLISAWEFQNHLYIMTDYCDNGTLELFLIKQSESTRSRLDEWRVWKILVEIIMGLKWVHFNNILHLDLKPANIFITFDGTLKIGDFGVSTKLPIISNFFDREGDREYIAPEIISKHEYTKAADIFSVGLIMVEVAANVILPDNGAPWRKLRSGDLTDAGKLSSSDLSERIVKPTSLFSSMHQSNETIGTDVSIHLKGSINNMMNKSIEPWTPYWFYDGSSTLDKLVSWMINPNPEDRPNCELILKSWECGLVELRRKSGATIYEGDYGPAVSREEIREEMMTLKSRNSYHITDV